MVNRVVWVVWVAGALAWTSGCAGAAFTGELDPLSETPDAVGQDADGGGGSSSTSSSSGTSSSSSSRTDDSDAGGAADPDSAPGPCDGGPLYLHHVGLKGLTWQDCVPTGTYDAAQAIAACTAYSAAVSGGACELLTNPALTPCAFSAALEGQASLVEWTYEGSGESTVTGRVGVGISDVNSEDGGLITVCTSADDPAWD